MVKQPSPYTFFVDRSLGGRTVSSALVAAVGPSEKVQPHDEHFAQNTPDVVWLAQVGAWRWVVLSKDKNIRNNAVERAALLNASVAAFFLGGGNVRGPDMAALFVSTLPAMRRVLQALHTPFIATILASGEIDVLWDAGGRLLKPPRFK